MIDLKRVAILVAVLLVSAAVAFAEFGADGGFLSLFADEIVTVADLDTIVLASDTVGIINAQNDTLRLAGGEFTTAPSQWGEITFITGANTDTVRYFSKASGDDSDDSLWLTVDLTTATSANDSAVINWYSDRVTVDTVATVAHEWPYAFGSNVFVSRLVSMTQDDSTGVKIVGQSKIGSNDEWYEVFAHTLDEDGEEATTAFADTNASGYYVGNYFRTLVITYDSTGGEADRINATKVEVYWRGRK